MSAVTFWAKGAAGGEKISVTAQGAAEIPVTLTNAWAEYSIDDRGRVQHLRERRRAGLLLEGRPVRELKSRGTRARFQSACTRR